ncbi:DUF2927 domain-containing protein [Palleronia sediminis]|uniref:DUF2927 domain-containing protein n=1 Tax=Palleronia sediminis TaxID=2547833 RepID=A0A4R6ABU6_9RHOB|nr:DUF2927 domain-containing protein [Palleronia sediminis]TDL81290.1 DUF2927 domain-containing protein [Palleronia sediminis]
MTGRTACGAALLALSMAACAEPPAPAPQAPPAPPQAAEPPSLRPAPPPAPGPSAESAALAAYYQRVERDLVAQGLLRRDGGGPDTPFDAEDLAETFIKVALYEEYSANTGLLVARQTESRLHRWAAPVRIDLRFGASVPASVQAADRAQTRRLVARIAAATGHPVTLGGSEGNFTVFVVNEDERRALGPELLALAPGLSGVALDSVIDMARSNYCVVFAVDPGNTGTYSRAVAIVRSEHPDLLRLSCLHEEIAQGMGLSNDSPTARPSIFNDDEEFALLTTHDELLLKMLYDPRLRPGMTVAEAAPIVRAIARELVGGEA